MEDLVIRKLQIEDAESICRIQESITKEPSTIDYRKAAEEEAKNKDGVSFVAELEGKVVGFIITYIIYGGFGLEKSAWIGLFGVDPKHGPGYWTENGPEGLPCTQKKWHTHRFYICNVGLHRFIVVF